MDATTSLASMVIRSMPTMDIRTHASMTTPLSSTRSNTSIRLHVLGVRLTGIVPIRSAAGAFAVAAPAIGRTRFEGKHFPHGREAARARTWRTEQTWCRRLDECSTFSGIAARRLWQMRSPRGLAMNDTPMTTWRHGVNGSTSLRSAECGELAAYDALDRSALPCLASFRELCFLNDTTQQLEQPLEAECDRDGSCDRHGGRNWDRRRELDGPTHGQHGSCEVPGRSGCARCH